MILFQPTATILLIGTYIQNQLKMERLTYWVCCIFLAVDFSRGQQLISPCPKIFQYEQKPNESDRWYGTATVMSQQELSGIWFRVLLDSPSIQLGVSYHLVQKLHLNAYIYFISDTSNISDNSKKVSYNNYLVINICLTGQSNWEEEKRKI